MSENITRRKILIIEDNQTTSLIYRNYLGKEFEVTVVDNGAEALESFQQHMADLVLLDLNLPDIDGIQLLQSFREIDKHIPIIIVTGDSSYEQVSKALHLKATDYLTKPIDRGRLNVTIANAFRDVRLTKRISHLNSSSKPYIFHGMVGRSPAITTIFEIIKSAAKSSASIFITGESGTGKELCAEAIHLESDRRNRPFIALNCAAIPRELLESELFGHVRGAFTGANTERVGAAKRADGGTLFLDEIGELPVDLQSKLLRFIQTRKFQPLGSNELVAVDVRFVCATNRDPHEAIAAGILREDLYYRLNVLPIHLPPLRERGDDVVLIARELLKAISLEENKSFQRYSNAVESVFRVYKWPGNIRELSNTIRKIIVLNDGDVITPGMIPSNLIEPRQQITQSPAEDSDQATVNPLQPMWKVEQEVILMALKHCDGRVRKAAKLLEIDPSTLYRKIERWNLKV
ncbi:sigma-54-dependent Fis family transcriptional regulator [Pseudidiomarina tainanensis]|uniref:Sigma-54-dependent Fis family transcriptional regulator n=1 Tax=Pseudidiomarina tainanensis TaxID=502365 RepID=A0ACD2HGS9_9GAMM|nr:sigma-54 dependent transcriptional regulator [Pseudidiomarina tainanensis]RZQ55730.1 sigma-54-dependent Fis family transcriptional regulator [Pseudidiomarina tainanensis]